MDIKFRHYSKINIIVITFIVSMENTTIAISKEFHDWLKSKGTKGDSYESIVRKLLKPEYAAELDQKLRQK